MRRISHVLIYLALMIPQTARADHVDITLAADAALIDSGLMKFLLPRFSLKTQIRLHLTAHNAQSPPADVTLTSEAPGGARPAIRGPKRLYHVILNADTNAKARRFTDWLLDDIGQRTIDQFRRDGEQVFFAAADAAAEVAEAPPEGDITNGERLAYQSCGRCHVIGPKNRMSGIGSTPSFALLRGFPDWQDRFLGFYALNPHPSFSQIKGVTPPFDIARPPAIIPLELTLQELDDIVAYIAGIAPADLGAPLQSQ